VRPVPPGWARLPGPAGGFYPPPPGPRRPALAEWAGHSVEVLLRIYAKCLDGGDALVRWRVEAALGHADADTGVAPLDGQG
jgi:hypothetical protein